MLYKEAKEAILDEICCKIVREEAEDLFEELKEQIKKEQKGLLLGTLFLLIFLALQLGLTWKYREFFYVILFFVYFILFFLLIYSRLDSIRDLKVSLSRLDAIKNNPLGLCEAVSQLAQLSYEIFSGTGICFYLDKQVSVLLNRCACKMKERGLDEKAIQWYKISGL